MSELLFGCDAAVAEWVAQRIPDVDVGFGPCSAIGVISNGKMMAGVVYHDFQPRLGTIQLSMAAVNPMWARRANLRALLSYPFNQLGVFKAWIATASDNTHGLKTFEHIGFKREAVLAHQFGRKRHAIVMRMLKPDFDRLFGEHHG